MIESYETMEALKAAVAEDPARFTEGYPVYVEELKEVITYRNGEWVAEEIADTEVMDESGAFNDTPKANGEITMSLYDMNRQLINQLPDYNEEAWNGAKEILTDYLTDHVNTYYMLYGRELNYFTVFKKNGDGEFDTLFDAVKTCLDSVGAVRSFDFDGVGACEIWVKPEVASTVTCMYLFPYDDGVVTFNE